MGDRLDALGEEGTAGLVCVLGREGTAAVVQQLVHVGRVPTVAGVPDGPASRAVDRDAQQDVDVGGVDHVGAHDFSFGGPAPDGRAIADPRHGDAVPSW